MQWTPDARVPFQPLLLPKADYFLVHGTHPSPTSKTYTFLARAEFFVDFGSACQIAQSSSALDSIGMNCAFRWLCACTSNILEMKVWLGILGFANERKSSPLWETTIVESLVY
jgi:hypothetical protein